MLQKSLAFVILWLLLQLLVEINGQMIPARRAFHTATYINNKLYILGGFWFDGNPGQDFFYLDVSATFDAKKLSWQDLHSVNTVPSHSIAVSAIGGANNNTLFLYGGATSSPDIPMNLIYTFDPQSNKWSAPSTVGDGTRKIYLADTINNKGKMYLWGGFDHARSLSTNDMLIFDTMNLSFGKGSLVGAPPPRFSYSAVLLPNNNILYTGGLDGSNVVTLNVIYIYDTINDSWSQKITSGKTPSNRNLFSTVLGLDGQRVIIWGGTNSAAFVSNIPPGDSLYVLNLTNFEWSIPKVSGSVPNNRISHKANVIGVYMVISFGIGYEQQTESDILLLDISNNNEYIWTFNFDPSITLPLATPSATSTNLPASASAAASSDIQQTNIGAIIGSLFGGILISFGSFFLYKWSKNKRKRNNVTSTLGDKMNNNKGGKLTSTERSINNHGEKELPIPAIKSNNQGQEIIIQIPKNENTTDNEIITEPVINEKYNHGQEVLITDPVMNNSDGHDASEKPSIQITDNELENFKRDMLQVVRQEIMQNLKLQNSEQS